MFASSDLDKILNAIQQKKLSIADQLKQSLRVEGASRHVAELAHQLRSVEQDEEYYVRFTIPQRALFSGNVAPVRHLGTTKDVEDTLAPYTVAPYTGSDHGLKNQELRKYSDIDLEMDRG